MKNLSNILLNESVKSTGIVTNNLKTTYDIFQFLKVMKKYFRTVSVDTVVYDKDISVDRDGLNNDIDVNIKLITDKLYVNSPTMDAVIIEPSKKVKLQTKKSYVNIKE